MDDENDIEFKGSLGSFPEIKWQQLSWGRGTLSLTPTLCLLLICFSQLSFQNILPLLVGGRGGNHWTSAARVPHLGSPFSVTKWAQPLPGISHQTHTEDSSLEFLAHPCFPPVQDHLPGERGPRPSTSREGHPGDGHRRVAETSNNSLEAALPSDGCAWLCLAV